MTMETYAIATLVFMGFWLIGLMVLVVFVITPRSPKTVNISIEKMHEYILIDDSKTEEHLREAFRKEIKDAMEK